MMTWKTLKPLLILLTLWTFAACQPTSSAAPTTPAPLTSQLTAQPTAINTLRPTLPAPTPLPSPNAGATRSPTPTRAVARRNQLVYTSSDSSLWIQDLTAREAKPLLKATSQDFYDAPAFSPDGSRIVYVFPTLDAAGKPTNEIRTVKVDGTDMRTLFKTPTMSTPTFLTYPRYSPDGAALYFSIFTYGATPREQKFQVVRGAASGGDWKTIVDGGYLPSPSLDGRRLVFLRLNTQTFASGLWVVNADGSNAQQLLADDVFLSVAGPHFSPDGKWIVFAASGPPQKKLPTAQLLPSFVESSVLHSTQERCAISLWLVCLVPRAYANGLPWELWLVSADGKGFKQLTRLELDSPWPAFSKDGRYVAFMTFDGTFEYDRQTNRVNQLSDVGGHGVIDWFQDD